MKYPKIKTPKSQALDLAQFKEMDYYTVENYSLPIELMMENAGLQLANLVASNTTSHNETILIGIGNGNNGGGGLVAARRLAAWGYNVYLDISTEISKELPKKQLDRALKFGAKSSMMSNPSIWVDAYLGFSQRLPLGDNLSSIISKANNCTSKKISLDIPTGFLGDISTNYFKADMVLSLAASKKILYSLPQKTKIFISDLGIPKEIYEKFGTKIPSFHLSNMLLLERSN